MKGRLLYPKPTHNHKEELMLEWLKDILGDGYTEEIDK